MDRFERHDDKADAVEKVRGPVFWVGLGVAALGSIWGLWALSGAFAGMFP